MKLHTSSRLLAIVGVLAVVVGLVAGTTGAGAKKSAKKQTIAEIAGGSSQFDTLTSLPREGRACRDARRQGKFTVFAPTDAAFAKVPKSTLDALGADTEKLKAVLLYHVASGKLTAKEGREALLDQDAERRLGEGARHEKGRQGQQREGREGRRQASNGVVHVINKVLLPPS